MTNAAASMNSIERSIARGLRDAVVTQYNRDRHVSEACLRRQREFHAHMANIGHPVGKCSCGSCWELNGYE